MQTWPDGAGRYESFAGVLTMTPSPTGRHQLAVAVLLDVLRQAAPPELLVLPAPYDWWVSPTAWYEPDVVVFERSHFDPDGPLRTTPLLVVEVTSPSTTSTPSGPPTQPTGAPRTGSWIQRFPPCSRSAWRGRAPSRQPVLRVTRASKRRSLSRSPWCRQPSASAELSAAAPGRRPASPGREW